MFFGAITANAKGSDTITDHGIEYIKQEFKQVETNLSIAKKDFFIANTKDKPDENKAAVVKLFVELDKILNLTRINYSSNGIQALKKDIEVLITGIYKKCFSSSNLETETSENLLKEYTNWHLGLFAIGAQHYPSSSAGKDTEERRSKIIEHLHDEKWWGGAEQTPRALEDCKVEIKVSLDNDGRKRLIIPTANDTKDAGEMNEVINRTIDELSNVNIINWKNVSKNSKFAKQAESMCLASWKGVAFDGIESPLSEIMPKEKGDWYNWVSKALVLKSPFSGVDDYYVKNLIQNVIGENKDILMEFLSNIIAHIDDKESKFNYIIGLLEDKQKKLIISSYQQIFKQNQVAQHVKIKAKFEVGILLNKLQVNSSDSTKELENELSKLSQEIEEKQNSMISKT